MELLQRSNQTIDSQPWVIFQKKNLGLVSQDFAEA
jgi:hypothetical protein